jgi:hypothetical protein
MTNPNSLRARGTLEARVTNDGDQLIDVPKRPRMRALLSRVTAVAAAVLLGPLPASGDPIRLHGVETAHLLPEKALEFRLGSHQANPPVQGVATGLQVYEGGASYRRGDWQLGARFSVYDDVPAGVIDGGAFGHLSLIGLGFDAKRQLIATDTLAWAIAASVEGLSFGSRTPHDDSADHLSGSISAPITLRLTPSLQAHLDPSIVKLPSQLKGGDGFGANAFLGAALSWQATPRVVTFAEVEVPLLGRGNTVDTGGEIAKAVAWSLGARIRIAPSADLDVYVSNRVAGTAASSGLVLPPMGVSPMFGAQLLYQPGRRDTTFPAVSTDVRRPSEGFIVRSGAVVPASTWDLRLASGLPGTFSGALSYSPDPGLQIDAVLERHAAASADYDEPPGRDPLFQFGGRFQALAPSGAWPIWLSAGGLAGRTYDFETRPWEPGRPTVGFIYADVSATAVLGEGLTVTLAPRAAAWRNEVIAGLGLGATLEIFRSLEVVAEASVNTSGPVTWASGLRWGGSGRLSASAFATNAIGLYGHGSILAAPNPRLEVKLEATL